MQTYILLTHLLDEENGTSFTISQKERLVADNIRTFMPEVTWIANYVTLGPWDYIDIFEAPDMPAALKVSSLVRYYGAAHTEVWPAMEWDSFDKTLSDLTHLMDNNKENKGKFL